MDWTMEGYKARKNGRVCLHCMYYDGELCTCDDAELEVAPFSTCDNFEDYFEGDEE